MSAAPLNRSGAGQGWVAHRVATPVLWAIFRDVYDDLRGMEAVLNDSDLDWTSVRPPNLDDKPGTGHYRRTIDGGPPGATIARADVARAMLDAVTDPATVRRTVGVSR